MSLYWLGGDVAPVLPGALAGNQSHHSMWAVPIRIYAWKDNTPPKRGNVCSSDILQRHKIKLLLKIWALNYKLFLEELCFPAKNKSINVHVKTFHGY